jgi:membrane-bound lytic murein transglycosylase D
MGRNLFRRTALRLFSVTLAAVLPVLAAPCFTQDAERAAEYAAQVVALLHPEELADAEPDVPRRHIGIDIPGDSELIDKFRTAYSKGFGYQRIVDTLDRSIVYRAYIREKLKENELPECLEYLPFIESEFNPKAVSKSGAVGLWQFMENSIANYLTKSGWLDERLDPWKATDAALKKLKANYDQFGDWALALAAYNGGTGAIQRALTATKTKTFWELAETGVLKDQTKQYVPKFLAISDLVMNAGHYQLSFPEIPEGFVFSIETINLDAPLYISQFCEELGIDRSIFSYLNPALLKETTPPVQGFQIRVPGDAKEHALQAAVNAKAPLSKEYTVKQGDTLWAISRANNITVSELCKINNIAENKTLSIGTVLSVPIN